MRLALLLSALWVIGVVITVLLVSWMKDKPGFDPPFVVWVDSAKGKTFSRAQVVEKIRDTFSNFTADHWEQFLKDNSIKPEIDWLMVLLAAVTVPVLLLVFLPGLAWGVRWVRQGFRQDKISAG